MPVLPDLWAQLLEPKLSVEVLERGGTTGEVTIIRAWKRRPLVSLDPDVYKRFYDALRPHERGFPEQVRKALPDPEGIQQGTQQDIRRRALSGALQIGGKVILNWLAIVTLKEWLDGKIGRRGGTVRNAIEKSLTAMQAEPSGQPDRIPAPPAQPWSSERRVLAGTSKEDRIMDAFVAAFQKAALENDGKVGRRTMGKLVREYEASPVPTLLGDGWITPEVAAGKTKIGWYRPGPKMGGAAAPLPAPTTGGLPKDPLERARSMLAQEPSLKARQAALEVELRDVNAQLERIGQLKAVYAQLTEIVEIGTEDHSQGS